MDVVKKYLAPAVAVLSFILITAVFFKPLVFEGKLIRQGDIQHHEGMSKEIVDFRAKEHREPLWTNSMFGGMPAYQISVLYPSNYMNPLQKAISVVTRIPFPITAILMCMIGFYFLMVTMKVDPWMSIAGAIAFGLTSYMITLIPAGHNSKMYAISYMAPVVMGVLLTYRGRLWLGASLTALALALEINANHLQITYYLVILLGFIGLGENIRLWKEKKKKEMGIMNAALAVAVVLAILPNISNLLLTNEYGKYTTRGASELTIDNAEHNKTDGLSIDYATQWCYTKSETMTLMIPDFMGGASEAISTYDPAALKKVDETYRESVGYQSSYFGDVIFTSGPYYVGAIICFLFVLAMFIVKDKIKWWLFGATVLAIMLSWGHNFLPLTEFFFKFIPGYNKFRAVSMILVVCNLTLPILAMLGIKEVMDDPGRLKQSMRSLYIAFGLTGGLSLLIWLIPGAFVTTVNETSEQQIIAGVTKQGGNMDQAYEYIAQLSNAREAVVSSDAGRSFLLILLAAALVWLFARMTYHKAILTVGIIGLVTLDMASVGMRYIDKSNYEKSKKHENPYPASQADLMILQDKDPAYRVLNIAVDVWQDASTSYYHKSIGGYHGAKLKRIQELYEQVLSKQITAFQQDLQAAYGGGISANPDSLVQVSLKKQGTINMFDTKYIIFNPDNGGVITNESACGQAWFVNNIKMVPNADSELVALRTIDTRSTAVVDQRFAEQLKGLDPKFDPAAKVSVVTYAPDAITYESNSSVEGLVMFPEVYYPVGWHATIDGKETDYICGDYVLRGIRVPAGKHAIKFEFHPDSYYTGEKIAMFGSILVFLFVIGGILMDVRSRKNNSSATNNAA